MELFALDRVVDDGAWAGSRTQLLDPTGLGTYFFEGASYETRGLYRPEVDCIMFARNPVGFCRVCRRAIERIIDLYAR